MIKATQYTKLTCKKSGKTLRIIHNTYEFCDDIWNEIKEFAGIYNYDIKWDKLIMKNNIHIFSSYINFTSSVYNFKNGEEIVRKQFWNNMNKGEFKNKKYTKKYVIEQIYKKFGVWKLSKDFQVGDEIWFFAGKHANDQTTRAGRIVSIAKDRKSYKIEEYSYGERTIEIEEFGYAHTCSYEWNKTNTKISIIRSDKNIKKGLNQARETIYSL